MNHISIGKTQRGSWEDCCSLYSPSVSLADPQSLLDCPLGCRKTKPSQTVAGETGGNLARQPICAQKLRVVLSRTWVDGLKHFHTLETSALCSPLLIELKHHYLVVVATLLVCPGPAGIFRQVSCWGLTIWCCGGGKQSIHLSFCLFTQHSCWALSRAGHWARRPCRCS